jgi:hypothetical protein
MQNKRTVQKWTPEAVAKLWDGSLADVAKKLGRSAASISVARTAYARFKPGNAQGLVPTEENLYKFGQKSKSGKSSGPKKAAAKIAKKSAAGARNAAGKSAGGNTNMQPAAPVSVGFRMSFDGQEITLPAQPKKLRISGDGLELEF